MTLKTNDNGTDRDMTAEEQAAHLAFIEQIEAETQARLEADQTKAAARQAVLDKLGLTDEEAGALFG